jgi:Periplasmic component of the Tol biopolymer transport system
MARLLLCPRWRRWVRVFLWRSGRLSLHARRKGPHHSSGHGSQSEFFRLDLETGEQRQLTSFDLKSGAVIQNFDISPDGKRIVFDRLRNHADIVLMNLAR